MYRAFVPKPNASSFSDWVYHQQNPRFLNKESSEDKYYMNNGRKDHISIDRIRASPWFSEHSIGNKKNYDVIYYDDGDSETIFASRLQVGGYPLGCKPDVVFRNKLNSHIIIIERKTTRQNKTVYDSKNWDNVECQLWCYSYIDDWVNSNNITLVCERWFCSSGLPAPTGSIASWCKGDDVHEKKCVSYFQRYGGKIV